jgi:hypothetical protein
MNARQFSLSSYSGERYPPNMVIDEALQEKEGAGCA